MKKKRDGVFFLKGKWTEILLCMKLTLLLFLCVITQVFASVDAQTISLKKQNASLEEIIWELKEKTSFVFLYSDEDISAVQGITINVKDIVIDDILVKCLEGTGLIYVKSNNAIIIRRQKEANDLPQVRSKKISGKVTDVKNEPLPGVGILIEGTTLGTTTDINGVYTLECPEQDNLILIFSFIGMKTRREIVKDRITVNVVMEQELHEMDEVVVTGIFTRKAESFTGSATTYKAEAIRRMGNQNLLASLKNLDPSFIMDDNLSFGSDPNKMPDIQIRGASSLPNLKNDQNNPNMPLFILDGFETTAEKVYDMDMNRVESVTLLKDAAAKAIYGSKAANGVVVIETKRPEAGKLRLTYTGDINIEMPDLSSYDLCDAGEKLQVEERAGRYTNSNPVSNQDLREQYNAIYKNIARGVNTYWLSKPLRTGVGHKHSLYLEGGDEYFRYGVDLAYNNVVGVMKGSKRTNISGGITLTYRYKSLTFRNYLELNSNKSEDSPYGSFSDYTKLNPYWTNEDEHGKIKKELGTFTSIAGVVLRYANPYYNGYLNTRQEQEYLNVSDNLYVEWQALENLKLIGRVGYSYRDDKSRDFYPADHTKFKDWTGDDFFRRGSYALSDTKNSMVKTDVTINYSTLLGKNLIFANAGWNLAQTASDGYQVKAEGLIDDQMDHISFAKSYEKDGRPTGTEGSSRELGFLAAINYSYDNRYLADFSYRANASSVFGADSRWGHFWSAGIGWNVHNEKFIHNTEVLNRLKLRASLGTTGSQNFSPYQAMATFGYYPDIYYNNIVGTYLLALANKDLKWQETEDLNVGFDLDLWKRFALRFDFYRSTTNNLLTDVTLPTSTGFSSFMENMGKSRNLGAEVVVSYKLINKPEQNAFLTVNASVAHNKNKLLKISNSLRKWNELQDAGNSSETDKTKAVTPGIRFEEGQSMNAIWAVRSLGINPADGKEVFLDKNGQMTYTWKAEDQVIAGDNNPKVRGNFGLNGEYRGWNLNLSFNYRLGGDIYNQTLVDRVENADIEYNVDRRVFSDRWVEVGDIAHYKSIKDRSWTRPTTRFVEKQNELKLSTVNLSYDFKFHRFMSRTSIERLKLAFYINDVFTVSSVKTERGLDYPFARTFSFSVQITL